MASTADTSAAPTRDIAFFVLPRFNMLTLASALEPLRVANYLAAAALYAWRHVSVAGGPVSASSGITVETIAYAALDAPPDMLVIAASWGGDHFHDPEVFAWLRRLERQGVMLVGLEMAVHILARAGLMAGRTATTHWSWMPAFAERYPQVEASERLFAVDGKLVTCAGGTATLDLFLDLIARHHGTRLAAEVADQVLHHPARPGDAPQRRTLGATTGEVPREVKAAIALMESNIAEPLPMPVIAARLGLHTAPAGTAVSPPHGNIGGALQPAASPAARPGALDQHHHEHPRRFGGLGFQLHDLFFVGFPRLLRQAPERLPPGLAGRGGCPGVAGFLQRSQAAPRWRTPVSAKAGMTSLMNNSSERFCSFMPRPRLA